MFKPNFGRALAALAALGAVATFPTAPAHADPTPSQCVQYSIQVCGNAPGGGPWEDLGYSSLKDCRLQEYANCMAGVPPYDPISFKPKAPDAAVPATPRKRSNTIG